MRKNPKLQTKKKKKSRRGKEKFETRSFIYYDEGPPRKRDEHQ
jgi:hypothetical protein